MSHECLIGDLQHDVEYEHLLFKYLFLLSYLCFSLSLVDHGMLLAV